MEGDAARPEYVGLEALTRVEGPARSRAYPDWFTALEQEGKHR